jgi:general stress protein YciG
MSNTTTSEPATRQKRGLSFCEASRRREIARLGGLARSLAGTGHYWTKEEAREAGKKGGKRSAEVRRGRTQP